MNDPDSARFNLPQRLERYAARTNPGLSAIALVLSTLVLAEAAARLPALYDEVIAMNDVALGSDPTALLPIDVAPSE